MKLKTLILLCAVMFISACSFDKIYLYPTKVPAEVRKLTLQSQNETTVVTIANDNFQPTFLRNGTDTIDLDFTIESVVFESANGHRLNGWMMKPKNNVLTVTLLHFHGNAGFLLNHYSAMTPLVQKGFQVFMFDYSGFGFSTGEASRKNVLADGNAALTYLKTRKDVKGTKLIIYGQSLGGHLSAVVASQRQSEIDGLVIEGAFSSHCDVAASRAGIFGRMLVSEKYCAYRSLRTFKKPVLIMHSTEDEVIPFSMGQKLYTNANEPKQFYEIKNCHICGPIYYSDSIAQKITVLLALQ
jgi:dipeptidyl aminopeptidase/acylaminoacyl peptidase